MENNIKTNLLSKQYKLDPEPRANADLNFWFLVGYLTK